MTTIAFKQLTSNQALAEVKNAVSDIVLSDDIAGNASFYMVVCACERWLKMYSILVG